MTDLSKDIQNEQIAFKNFIALYDDRNLLDHMIYPLWDLKDLLAHLVFWQESFARNVEALTLDNSLQPL